MKKLIPALLLLAIAAYSCKTSEPEPEPEVVTAPAITMPSIKGVDGIFVAIKMSTKSGGTESFTGTGQAVFYKSASSTIKVEAGRGKLAGKTLIKSDDNIYFYAPTTAEPKGIVFGTQILWEMSANAANGVPQISDNDGGGFPNTPVLPESIILDQTQVKNISWVSSVGSDSTILLVKGPNATFKQVLPPSVTFFDLAKSDIAKLGVGAGEITIINYKVTQKTFGGKSYAFVKQSTAFTNKVAIK